MPATKTCKKCQVKKSLSSFGRNACVKDGYDFYCFECRGAQVVKAYTSAPRRKNLTLRDRLIPELIRMRQEGGAEEWYRRIFDVLPEDMQRRLTDSE